MVSHAEIDVTIAAPAARTAFLVSQLSRILMWQEFQMCSPVG